MQILGGEIATLNMPQSIAVLNRDSTFFARLTRHEFELLTSRHAAYVIVKAKSREVQHGRLLIAARGAQRILRHVASQFVPALSISKHHANRGAMEWAPRFDKAKSGHSTRVIQIQTSRQSANEYADRLQFAKSIGA